MNISAQSSDEVTIRNQPVVVLESTVIAHGLPWPENLDTALAMEAAVRSSGAVPATIAILEGEVRIGLTVSELEQVARWSGSPASSWQAGILSEGLIFARRFLKANRRDLSMSLTQKQYAATTVSASLWLAQRFGLRPCAMATGGLGGVHRGAADTFDVSTDLDELARADGSVVVCSGFKSILDLSATLEALETRGVAIVGYRTSHLPAFTAVSSGLPLEHRVESPEEAAALVRTHRELGLPGAVVLANPAPAGEAVDGGVMEAALERAQDEARQHGVRGKAVTPFLLEAIRQATGGQSLRANRALLVANAQLAAEVAVALHRRAAS